MMSTTVTASFTASAPTSPSFIYAAGKAEKELRGVKRYVNLFYRIYNGRRRHSTLPMKF